jgi:hypothetical protein
LEIVELLERLHPDEVLPAVLKEHPEDSAQVRQARAWRGAVQLCCGFRRPIDENGAWRAKRLLTERNQRLDYDRPLDVAGASPEGLQTFYWLLADPYDQADF